MKAKISGMGKVFLIPVFAMALAGGGFIMASSGSTDDAAATVGGATVASASPSPSESPKPRFHGDGTTACPLPDGVTLDGNWTHGDYVSAWAKTGDHDKTLAAAHSDCGKPMSAVDKSKKDKDDATEHNGRVENAKDDDEADEADEANEGAEHANEHADDHVTQNAGQSGEDHGKSGEDHGQSQHD